MGGMVDAAMAVLPGVAFGNGVGTMLPTFASSVVTWSVTYVLPSLAGVVGVLPGPLLAIVG
jgi:hypothetical protein